MHYYNLLEGAEEFKIVCPFHVDQEPSMKIDLTSGIFFCFGCYASGNALDFVKFVNKRKDELECCRLYYRILHSKKVKSLKIDKKLLEKQTKDYEQALVEAEDHYFGLNSVNWKLENNQEKEYMIERGFSSSALNLCKAKININRFYSIIFPMLDLGVFKGWVCRTTNKRIEKKRKYLYNEGFSRSNTLVGDYAAEVVVLVEGYMDWLKMRQYGVKKVAAILGWKITQQQIEKLKGQGAKIIISALDNDKCGLEGSIYLKQYFKVVRFRFPKGIKDPGEMDRKTFEKANLATKKRFRELKKFGVIR